MSSTSNRQLFLALLSPSSGEKILDVGAGKGVVARWVLEASNGAEVYAIDPDTKRVSSMRQHSPELKSHVAGVESIPFPDSFFDKVYTTMAVHHFESINKAVRELSRVLKQGGLLVILDVDPRYGRGRLLRFFENGILRRGARFVEEGQLVSVIEATRDLRISRSTRSRSGYFIQCTRV